MVDLRRWIGKLNRYGSLGRRFNSEDGQPVPSIYCGVETGRRGISDRLKDARTDHAGAERRSDRNLKFGECLPPAIAGEVFAARFDDVKAIANIRREPMRVVVVGHLDDERQNDS